MNHIAHSKRTPNRSHTFSSPLIINSSCASRTRSLSRSLSLFRTLFSHTREGGLHFFARALLLSSPCVYCVSQPRTPPPVPFLAHSLTRSFCLLSSQRAHSTTTTTTLHMNAHTPRVSALTRRVIYSGTLSVYTGLYDECITSFTVVHLHVQVHVRSIDESVCMSHLTFTRILDLHIQK